jgi:hypothetical protein
MLSIRARGLLDLIEENNYTTLDELTAVCTETPKYIGFCLDELLSQGFLVKKDSGFSHVPKGTYLPAGDIFSRITALYKADRIYDIIAWYIASELDISDDTILRRVVNEHYNEARTVQYWTNEEIFNEYDKLRKGKYGFISFKELHEALTRKSRGV